MTADSRTYRLLLYLIVFSAGLVSLGVELAASRLLDPWFGNSILVWASLIGLILLYLSVGYWLGGKIADRDPRPSTLYTIVAVAATAVGLVPLVAQPILRLTADVFVTYDTAILLGSFSAILLLFGIPVILLGVVSPFAIRLLVHERRGCRQQRGSGVCPLDRWIDPGYLPSGTHSGSRPGHVCTFLILALGLLGPDHDRALVLCPTPGAALRPALGASPDAGPASYRDHSPR